MPLFLILPLVLVAALLAILLAAFAATALLAAFVLHKLGWDRRLIAYLLRKQGVHVATFRFPEKPEVDRMDAPIEAHWTVVEERRTG